MGYGFGDTASNIVWQVVMSFAMYFYTDVFGITAAVAGTLMLVVTLFDMVTDPIMGGIADRTRTRWGKYRPYLIWMAIPYGIFAVLAFTTPDLTVPQKIIYAYVTHILLRAAYTAINIPYGALGGVMTADPNERGEIQGYRFAMAMVGNFIVSATLLSLVERLGNGNDQTGFTYAMMVLSVVALICFFLCFISTKERLESEESRNESTILDSIKGIFSDFWVLLKSNREWAIVAVATFFLLVIAVLRGGIVMYYAKYFLSCSNGETIDLLLVSYDACNPNSLGTAIMTVGTLGSIVGAITTIFLTRTLCKTVIMKFAALCFIVTSIGLYFVQSDMLWMAIILNTLGGYFHIMMIVLVFAMTADTVDWGEYVNGSRATAMTFSGHLFALKFGAAIGGFLLGKLLTLFEYAEPIDKVEQVQPESALNGISLILSIIPAGVCFAVLVCCFLYSLTSSRLIQIQKEIQSRAST